MVQGCDMSGVSNSDNNFSLGTPGSNSALEKILSEHPGEEFEVIQFSDGKYVRFLRKTKSGQTSYLTFYHVKINGS